MALNLAANQTLLGNTMKQPEKNGAAVVREMLKADTSQQRRAADALGRRVDGPGRKASAYIYYSFLFYESRELFECIVHYLTYATQWLQDQVYTISP
jgi:hypothetical protein